MQPMATLLTQGEHPTTVLEVRVNDIVNMQTMATMRQEVEESGFTWLDCDREGSEVCLVKIGSKDGVIIDKPAELKLQRAIDAAGILMLG